MIDTASLNNERKQLFIQSHGSIYLPIIGVFFWPSLGIAGFFLSPQTICLLVLFMVLIAIPIAIIMIKHLIKKRFLKSPLATLILPALLPILMSFAITIPLYFTNISLVPLAFVLGLSLHWPAVGWLYNQRVFIVHSVTRTLVTLLIWYLFPAQLFTLLPMLIGLLYLATSAWLLLALCRAKAS